MSVIDVKTTDELESGGTLSWYAVRDDAFAGYRVYKMEWEKK